MRSLVALALLLAACQPAEPAVPGLMERTGEVLQVVNGQNITQGMVDASLANLPASTRDRIVAQGQTDMIKEQLLMGELLYQKAVELKLHEKPEVKTAIAMAERDAMARLLLEQIIAERSTDEAVKAWYDDHAVQFKRPQVKASHILVKDEAKAKELLAKVQAGGDFAQLARENSVDPGSAKNGGDLGWFEQNRMVKEFAEAAFAAEKGAVVGPVKTQFGFHIIRVEDKRDSVPLDEVKDKIKGQLRNEIVEKYLEELKGAATITVPGASTGGATVTPGTAPADLATDKKPDAPAAGAPAKP